MSLIGGEETGVSNRVTKSNLNVELIGKIVYIVSGLSVKVKCVSSLSTPRNGAWGIFVGGTGSFNSLVYISSEDIDYEFVDITKSFVTTCVSSALSHIENRLIFKTKIIQEKINSGLIK